MALFAQPNDTKRDAVWLLGYDGEGPGADTSTYNGNTMCIFTENEVSMSILHTPIRFMETCAGISDTTGKMLFYTNGAIIIDSSYQIMQNSENFNESSFTTYWEEAGWGLTLPQGALVLPMPKSS